MSNNKFMVLSLFVVFIARGGDCEGDLVDSKKRGKCQDKRELLACIQALDCCLVAFANDVGFLCDSFVQLFWIG